MSGGNWQQKLVVSVESATHIFIFVFVYKILNVGKLRSRPTKNNIFVTRLSNFPFQIDKLKWKQEI